MNTEIQDLEAALDFWNMEIVRATVDGAPYEEIELLRVTRKLVAAQLSEAQFANDDTVRLDSALIGAVRAFEVDEHETDERSK